MNMFDKLTDTELEMMTNYINWHAGIENTVKIKQPLSYILRFWNQKTDLFALFGGELILSKKISITKPQSILQSEISDSIFCWGSDARKFVAAFENWARLQNYDLRYNLLDLLRTDYLASNRYDGKTFIIPAPNDKIIAVNTGCKLSKIIGKIASTFDIEGYEAFRLAHSLCLNQKTLQGELCLSIHPLDYMTMSDNNCGWSSCMSWQETGDYRQGTVEMMNSRCVVVAYLKSSENMEIGSYTWNSKKWRQLFIVTPEIIVGIKQYPYESDELRGISLNWLRELAEKNVAWGPYGDTALEVSNNTKNLMADRDHSFYLSVYTRFMYNDFYSRHLSYVSTDIPPEFELCFSGESECMICGEDMSGYCDSDFDTASLCCLDCEDVLRCSECGGRIDRYDAICVDGYYYCESCYDNYFGTCELCEETYHDNELVDVYLRANTDEGARDVRYYIRVCEHCLNNEKFVKMFGHSEEISEGWITRIVVNLENFTLDGIEHFNVWYAPDYEAYHKRVLQNQPKAE